METRFKVKIPMQKIYKIPKKKKSVGVQILSRDKKGALVAILQVRSQWNEEKNSPESYPGTCQVTVHGKLEEGEDFIQALLREVLEELGAEIVPIIRELYESGQLIELVDDDSPERQIVTFGAIIREADASRLVAREKSPSFGGFKLIHRDEIDKIINLRTLNKEIGVTDETIAMFPDEKEAVKLAFEKFS